jgi:hypothetical protein
VNNSLLSLSLATNGHKISTAGKKGKTCLVVKWSMVLLNFVPVACVSLKPAFEMFSSEGSPVALMAVKIYDYIGKKIVSLLKSVF